MNGDNSGVAAIVASNTATTTKPAAILYSLFSTSIGHSPFNQLTVLVLHNIGLTASPFISDKRVLSVKQVNGGASVVCCGLTLSGIGV